MMYLLLSELQMYVLAGSAKHNVHLLFYSPVCAQAKKQSTFHALYNRCVCVCVCVCVAGTPLKDDACETPL